MPVGPPGNQPALVGNLKGSPERAGEGPKKGSQVPHFGVGKRADDLLRSFEVLVHLDWLLAKAKFGLELGARFPEITEGEVYLKDANTPCSF